MLQKTPTTPLSNIQVELLRLYAAGVSDETLLELKKVISHFLMQKLREEAGKAWVERNYTEENINEWLGKHYTNL